MKRVGANAPLICTYHALQMTLFPVAIITLFWKHEIGLSMSEIMLLQGLFGLAMAVFEFPSGYMADRLGYRRTLIIAATISAIGWGMYCLAWSFTSVLIAELVLGIGMSLVSGSDSALLYESLHEEGRESEFGRWTGRVRFFGQGAEGTAALLAGLLFVWWSRLPFVLEMGIWVINIFVALRLTEPSREKPPTHDHWRQIRHIVHHALRENRALRAIIGLTIVLSLSSFIPVWIVPLYAQESGVPVAWIGPIWALANYTVAICSLWSDRVGKALGLSTTLLVCVGLIAVGYLGLGLCQALLGFAFYFCLTSMRGLFGPVLHHEEQRLIPSSDRAGFISLRSLLFRVSFLAIGPWIGMGIDSHGHHRVLLIVGIAITSLAAACWIWWVRTRRVQTQRP